MGHRTWGLSEGLGQPRLVLVSFSKFEKGSYSIVARRNTPDNIPPSLPPEKGLEVFKKQLTELQKLKTRHHEEARRDEQSWYEMTKRFMDMTFGSPNHHSQSFG